MSSLLSHKHLQNEKAAYAWIEAHLWPDGPICLKCGSRVDAEAQLELFPELTTRKRRRSRRH